MTPFPQGKFAAIYADPPWAFEVWSKDTGNGRSPSAHYPTQSIGDLCALPVTDIAADDCVLFMWACWPTMKDAFALIEAWGFKYKTCAFTWMKADPYVLFADDKTPFCGMGYWTRANSEVCLLATRGKSAKKPILYLSPRRLSDTIRFPFFVKRAVELADSEVRG